MFSRVYNPPMLRKEYLLGLTTVLFWSTSATAFKLTLNYLDVLQLLLFAILTSTLVLGGYLVLTGRIKTVFSLSPKEYGFYLILGFLNPFIYYWMAVKAYDLLPAQIAQPINYTWVITLSLLCVPLLKQPLSKLQVLATLVCYSGVVVLSTGGAGATGEAVSRLGIFLAVSCTIIWALYWITNVKSTQDPVVGIFLNFIFSIPFVALACSLFSSFAVPDIKGLFGAVWIGCFEFGFAFITWITALKSARQASHVANLIFLTPFISLVFISTVLGETIQLRTFEGLALIIAGIAIQKLNDVRA